MAEINLAGLKLKNAVMPASGTFGYGAEYADFFDLSRLGAIVTKTITLKPRAGNPMPRLAEVPNGLVNSIGLQNDGIIHFLKTHLPYLKKIKTNLIVNIAGETVAEYAKITKLLDRYKDIDAFEVNISCPNVKKGGMAFGADPATTAAVIAAVRKATKKPVIAKLTPNVKDITVIAKSAAQGGANALSLINTIVHAAPVPGTKKIVRGGLSGPTIKPIALQLVAEAVKAVDIPVIGIGGIMNTQDALEFLNAGAKAIQVGTANFVNPMTMIEIIEGLSNFNFRP